MSHLSVSLNLKWGSARIDLPRRLGAEPDHEDDGYGRNESSGQHDSPRVVADSVEDQVGAEAEEDTEGDPKLEGHDERSSDDGRGAGGKSLSIVMRTLHSRFGRVDGDGRDLGESARLSQPKSRSHAPSCPYQDR